MEAGNEGGQGLPRDQAAEGYGGLGVFMHCPLGHKDAGVGGTQHLGEPASIRKMRYKEHLENGEGHSDKICFQGKF